MSPTAVFEDALQQEELLSRAQFYNESEEESDVQKFYNGQTVFITGGTGFLGKIIIEKLLRITKVKKIYLLIRAKKNVLPQDRLELLTSDSVFDRLRGDSKNSFGKISVFEGDIEQPGLGLSEKDRNVLLNESTIIIHSAATVRFNENLKIATQINVCGTKETIALAHQVKNLIAFVYVSTAFSHCPRGKIEEKFYESPIDVDLLLSLKELLDEEQMEILTPSLLKEWPNTYVFTKAVAEEVVRVQSPGLPLTVVRPAIITAVYNEPVPGWIDNLYGPSGIVVGSAVGILRTIHCNRKVPAEIVPGDMTGNCILAAAWDVGKRYEEESNLRIVEKEKNRCSATVFNFCAGKHSISWEKMTHYLYKFGTVNAPSNALLSCDVQLHSNFHIHKLYALFFHFIPAYIIDFITGLLGKSKGLTKMYKKIAVFSELLGYFATRYFDFETKNVTNLYKTKLSEKDRRLFNFDVSSIKWDDYIRIYYLGTRKYLMKDDPKTIPEANIRYQRLEFITMVVKICACLFFFIFILITLFRILT